MVQTPKQILLLDDDYESMAPLKIYLEEVQGHCVTLTAADLILDRLRQEKFNLICLDLMIHPISLDEQNEEVTNIRFPGVNWQKTGLAFLERLRAGTYSSAGTGTVTDGGTSPLVPVIILSAVADRSREEQLLRADEQISYLEKPFDLDEIVELIEHIL